MTAVTSNLLCHIIRGGFLSGEIAQAHCASLGEISLCSHFVSKEWCNLWNKRTLLQRYRLSSKKPCSKKDKWEMGACNWLVGSCPERRKERSQQLLHSPKLAEVSLCPAQRMSIAYDCRIWKSVFSSCWAEFLLQNGLREGNNVQCFSSQKTSPKVLRFPLYLSN